MRVRRRVHAGRNAFVLVQVILAPYSPTWAAMAATLVNYSGEFCGCQCPGPSGSAAPQPPAAHCATGARSLARGGLAGLGRGLGGRAAHRLAGGALRLGGSAGLGGRGRGAGGAGRGGQGRRGAAGAAHVRGEPLPLVHVGADGGRGRGRLGEDAAPPAAGTRRRDAGGEGGRGWSGACRAAREAGTLRRLARRRPARRQTYHPCLAHLCSRWCATVSQRRESLTSACGWRSRRGRWRCGHPSARTRRGR